LNRGTPRSLDEQAEKVYRMVYVCKHSRRTGRFRRMSRKAIEATTDHNLIFRQFSNTDRFLMLWMYDWSGDTVEGERGFTLCDHCRARTVGYHSGGYDVICLDCKKRYDKDPELTTT
jgi:hypothetical protein